MLFSELMTRMHVLDAKVRPSGGSTCSPELIHVHRYTVFQDRVTVSFTTALSLCFSVLFVAVGFSLC